MSATGVTADVTADRIAVGIAESPKVIRRLVRRPVVAVCIVFLLSLLVVAIVAPLAMPWVSHQQAGNLLIARQGPSSNHLLGTDSLGRDVLERLLVGTRSALLGVAYATIVAVLIGLPGGLIAGYFGGRLDQAASWLANLAFSMPALIIALVVLTVFPFSMVGAMVTVGVLSAPFLMRVVRSTTLPVREELYIAAAQVTGLSRPYIITRHVLPRIAAPVIVQVSLLAGAALLAQAGFAYLGLLGAPPAPTWGGMLNDGLTSIVLQPWLIWPPGLAITLTVLAFGMLGDGMRDATSETWSGPARRKRSAQIIRTEAGVEAAGAPPLVDDAGLTIRGLSVGFPSPQGEMVPVVDDVSFEVRAGETVGLVGESGCGKTMTAMAILGLVPGNGEVTSGQVWFDGKDLVRTSNSEMAGIRGRHIGLISQEPMVSLNPVFRIGWQLASLIRIHHGLSMRDAKRRVVALLEQVRLPDPELVARRYPHELSGGMAQRVAIARALAGEPELLIADEPTTALDVTVQAEILDLLRDLQRDRGMAILLVTHDWGVVADLCDRAVVMYAGQVVERADIRPIFSEPLHPYTEALLASNPHSLHESGMLPTIPGTVPKPGEWPAGCHFHPRCHYATEACRGGRISLELLPESRETRCVHYDELVHAQRRRKWQPTG